MKILEMNLLAYGPFTDRTLDFSKGSQGLHFVLGPNEAGKSTTLRALQYMLYGIPPRCADDFLHPYTKMRIGARICGRNGETLSFVRRKGRSNTLREMDDKAVVDEVVLGRFLNGVDVDLFTTLFGIDYSELTKGGEQIVSGDGNLGKLLFSAGSGVADLGRVQKELQDQADALFKRAAQKPVLNATLSQIDGLRKEMREAQLPGRRWTEHDQSLREAKQRMQVVEQELLEQHRELNRLKRTEASLPIIARRKELIGELESVADAAVLSPDFCTKRQDLTTKLKVAANSHEQSLQRIENLSKEISEQNVPEDVLAVSKEIDSCYRELGSLQKADKDRIQLRTRHSTLMAEAGDILKSLHGGLSIENVETLRIKRADMIRIQELGMQHEGLVTRRNSIIEERTRLEYLLAENQKQKTDLIRPSNLKELKNVLGQAEEHSANASYCREEQLKLRNASTSLGVNIIKLGLWSGTPEELERLSLPSTESISIFESRLESLGRKLDGFKERRRRLSDRRQEIDSQIRAMQMERRVPTQMDLDAIRSQREDGWLLLRSILENHPADDSKTNRFVAQFSNAADLVEAYEIAVKAADQLADRLRREADSVAALANLSTEREAVDAQKVNLDEELLAAENALKRTAGEWEKLWESSGISPRSPKEMLAWLQRQQALAEKAVELRERKTTLDCIAVDVNQHSDSLEQCLIDLGEPAGKPSESLIVKIKRGRLFIEKEEAKRAVLERHQSEEKHWRKELDVIESKAMQTETELAHWKEQWGKAMQLLGLDETAIPRQANAVIEEVKKLFEKLKEARILHQRIEGIGRDEDAFALNVKQLTRQVAADLDQLSAKEAIIALNQRLVQARSVQSLYRSQSEALKQEEERCRRSANKKAEIETRLDLLCQEASCRNHEELPKAEIRSENRCRIETELAKLGKDLRKLSAGVGIEEFVAEALKIDPDSIISNIQVLKESVAKLDAEKAELNQTIGREHNELSKMDGSAHAAGLAEKIQLLLGRLQNDVEQYARLRLATVVLNRAIERYRDKNQGPILTHAGHIFAQLTCGAFEGVRADFDGKGEPVLVGVRADAGEIVGVEGMSDGTADQLYLALRLAGLLDYLERNEPMPFVVDDILIQFDDKRATAALESLAELSQKTQVIFFSHHQHLLELARKVLPEDVLIPHYL